jgi:hypothetical protein
VRVCCWRVGCGQGESDKGWSAASHQHLPSGNLVHSASGMPGGTAASAAHAQAWPASDDCAIAQCSGHGRCLTGSWPQQQQAALACKCDFGYYGPACGSECPGGAAKPCHLRGTCDGLWGACQCLSGYAGPDCSAECPGGHDQPCTGHGVCDPSRVACHCQPGYSGGACQVESCAVDSRALVPVSARDREGVFGLVHPMASARVM